MTSVILFIIAAMFAPVAMAACFMVGIYVGSNEFLFNRLKEFIKKELK